MEVEAHDHGIVEMEVECYHQTGIVDFGNYSYFQTAEACLVVDSEDDKDHEGQEMVPCYQETVDEDFGSLGHNKVPMGLAH